MNDTHEYETDTEVVDEFDETEDIDDLDDTTDDGDAAEVHAAPGTLVRPVDDLVGVRFIEAGPVSYCNPAGLGLGVGDYVVVRTDRGERLGWVVIAADQVLASSLPQGPRNVVDRIANGEDVRAWEQNKERAAEDRGRAQALATRNDPRVRVAGVTYDLAGHYGEVTFTAPERVEHRWLEQSLADLLEADLAVMQVGDRDRAKAAGGLGVCGLELCCSSWMTEFPSISIKMAKDQDLAPNPSKISGVCGRLLCCLSFEVEAYRELRGDLPKVGKRVTTPAGRAKVLSVNSLKQMVRLRFDETGQIIEISAEELRKQYGTVVRPEELEPVVEEPARRRDRRNREQFVGVMTPTERPAARPVAKTAPVTVAVDMAALDAVAEGEAVEGETEGTDADGTPRKRRRRGRRGGRGRNRAAGEGGAEETTEPASDE
ncbi:MAG: regulatory iron-sulfur-containing complex subunit RicT [Dehalococcoidia bacterium]